jgi:hypothetical protein
MKTLMPTFLMLLFAAPAMAQELVPRVVKPIRVSIITEAGPEDSDAVKGFHKAFRAELNKRRDVAACASATLDIYLSASDLTSGGRLRGYASAVLVVAQANPRENYWLSLKTGADLETLARDAVTQTDEQVLDSFRRGK